MAESFGIIFPHPTLTPINEAPTQASLKVLRQEIIANARAVHSQRGGGSHGHLSLVVSVARYAIITRAALGAAVVFLVPVAPGAAPVHPANATGHQINEANRQFLEDAKEHRLYLQTEAALKKLVLQAVPKTYTEILCDDEMGYAEVTTLNLLTHLDSTYGIITEDELELNRKLLYQHWDMNLPIEEIFTQIRKCQAFALLTDPISNSTAIRAGLEIFEATGHFTIAIREWRSKAAADKTLPNFRTHFTLADTERKRTATSRSAGYHQAAQVSTSINVPVDPVYFYCWSHGLGCNPNHTSKSCNNKAPNHKDHATLHAMCGGNAIIQRRRNDIQVYVRPQRTAPTTTATNA